MPVIENVPFPPGHPFHSVAIIFGQKRPDSSEKPSKNEQEEKDQSVKK